jgi:glycine hydroxymethyltransferase
LKNVLFVCTGNICRSPMAEFFFRQMAGGGYTVGSAGLAAIPGQPASRHTADILREAGLDPAGFSSRPLLPDMIEEATHVFAMSRQHSLLIEDEFPDFMDKVYLVSEFSPEDSLRGRDVHDPFGQGRSAYEATRDMLLACLPSVHAFIEQTSKS